MKQVALLLNSSESCITKWQSVSLKAGQSRHDCETHLIMETF